MTDTIKVGDPIALFLEQIDVTTAFGVISGDGPSPVEMDMEAISPCPPDFQPPPLARTEKCNV